MNHLLQKLRGPDPQIPPKALQLATETTCFDIMDILDVLNEWMYKRRHLKL